MPEETSNNDVAPSAFESTTRNPIPWTRRRLRQDCRIVKQSVKC